MRRLKACFFARVRDPELLEIIDFYRNDITCLEELGFDVIRATKRAEIPWDADLYWTWWWGSGVFTLPVSLLRGRPNVFTGTLQLDPQLGWWKNYPWYKRALVRLCVAGADQNVAICNAELRWLEQLRAKHCHVVYQGIDTRTYSPLASVAKEDRVVVVSQLTADNVDRKRLKTLIRAWPSVAAKHRHAVLEVVGPHGNGYPELLALARSLGVHDSVEFPGRVTRDEKINAFRRARVYAQPSIYEGFGLAIAEAMACGLPVVTSPRGAIPEVVGDTALLAEPDDHDAFAAAINRLLDDRGEASKLGRRARERVLSMFSYEAHRAGMADVIRQAMPGWTAPERYADASDAHIA